jgi:GNAT superfamily N-acetyltransferase
MPSISVNRIEEGDVRDDGTREQVIFLHHHSERDIAWPFAEKPPEGGFSNMRAVQPPGQGGGGGFSGRGDGNPGTAPPATASISSGANSRTPGSNSLSLVACFIFYQSSRWRGQAAPRRLLEHACQSAWAWGLRRQSWNCPAGNRLDLLRRQFPHAGFELACRTTLHFSALLILIRILICCDRVRSCSEGAASASAKRDVRGRRRRVGRVPRWHRWYWVAPRPAGNRFDLLRRQFPHPPLELAFFGHLFHFYQSFLERPWMQHGIAYANVSLSQG